MRARGGSAWLYTRWPPYARLLALNSNRFRAIWLPDVVADLVNVNQVLMGGRTMCFSLGTGWLHFTPRQSEVAIQTWNLRSLYLLEISLDIKCELVSLFCHVFPSVAVTRPRHQVRPPAILFRPINGD